MTLLGSASSGQNFAVRSDSCAWFWRGMIYNDCASSPLYRSLAKCWVGVLFERRCDRKRRAEETDLVSASSAHAANSGRGVPRDAGRRCALAECRALFPVALPPCFGGLA